MRRQKTRRVEGLTFVLLRPTETPVLHCFLSEAETLVLHSGENVMPEEEGVYYI